MFGSVLFWSAWIYSHQCLTLCPLPPVQTFDKQGFHAGTPPPFSLPSALGSTGPLNPGAAPGYAPAPFLHILPAHQQPHSQMLHHHLQQDGQVSQPLLPLQHPREHIAPTSQQGLGVFVSFCCLLCSLGMGLGSSGC